jgi:hypothetical protein
MIRVTSQTEFVAWHAAIQCQKAVVIREFVCGGIPDLISRVRHFVLWWVTTLDRLAKLQKHALGALRETESSSLMKNPAV